MAKLSKVGKQSNSNPTAVGGIYVKGKFLYQGNEKLYLKGVTYGTFAPQCDENQFPIEEIVENDIRQMAKYGINCLRTYTIPPKYLLDIALAHNIKVMAGLPWEQHVTFLDDRRHKKDIIRRVREGVQSCSHHPAVLCFAIGNEIPAQIVRWYGKEKIEGFLKELFYTVKAVNPATLVTYVNYPTTEYLNLSFLDFDCWNVYLETPEKLSSYIARLHNLSGDRPMVLAEIGLDSMRNGHEKQADVLRWQIETIFGKGCAGMFIFAWTDEWWRGGFEIEDWDFGLVDRKRNPKPALNAVYNAMQSIPVPQSMDFPFISVILCSYNGSATIRQTMEALQQLNYPRFEVIVVNDGSTDNLVSIVNEFPVKLLNIPNGGLSNARNIGMNHSQGEIIAYIDDDAYPDPHWLHYLAYAYRTSTHNCIGGPNIAPFEDGTIASCVANAPGGPVHVLETDEIAEHVPGCNMSFRREALLKIGGFDPQYRSAGDDVDICWRIRKDGGSVGFHPSALVWHHRRNSVKAYWKQQKGYGKAEALLEVKWPEKYNGFGHITWAGHIYGNGSTLPLKLKKDKVFHGTWGSALFQSIYHPKNGVVNTLSLMPEWYFVVILLGMLSLLGFLWTPLLLNFSLFIASVLVIVVQAFFSTIKNSKLPPEKRKWRNYLLIMMLHIIQPIARLSGRLLQGLTPLRKRGNRPSKRFVFLLRLQLFTYWSETWRSNEEWLSLIEKNLFASKTRVRRGGDFDRWDIELRNGIVAINRAMLAIEEHGAGKQFIRLKTWTSPSRSICYFSGFLILLSILALINEAWITSCILAFLIMIIAVEYITENAVLLNKLDIAFRETATSINPVKETRQETIIQEEIPLYLEKRELGKKESDLNGRSRLVKVFQNILTRNQEDLLPNDRESLNLYKTTTENSDKTLHQS